MRRFAALVSTLLLAVAMAACGDDGGTTVATDPLAAVLAAPEKTVEAESAKTAIDVKMSGQPGELTIEGEGVVSLTDALGRLTLRMSGLPGVGEIEIEQVISGNLIYMRSELFSNVPGVETEWVSLDLQEAAEQAGVDVSQMTGQQSDPTQTLAYLKGAAGEVDDLGTENVRGVETTHYRAMIDPEKAWEQAGAITDREALRKTLDQIGDEPFPTDVWVDGDGLARRIAISVPMETPQGKVAMDMAMEFFDFGTEVDVEPPPANEVTDLSDLGAPSA